MYHEESPLLERQRSADQTPVFKKLIGENMIGSNTLRRLFCEGGVI